MYTVHALCLTVALVLALGLTGCGSSEQSVMPSVVGTQFDAAKSIIERAGFGGEVEVLGGGMFGIVTEPNWQVCEQLPLAGETLTDPPRLTVDRSCETAPEPTEVPVFVKKSDAVGWQDGTKVEMIVAMVEVTINGETSDGWLRAQSVKIIS